MATRNIWKYFENEDLEGYTLVIPSVAVGNVGQLACDLLMSSLDMKKIISIYSPAVIPVSGYDPYDLKSQELMTSCEVYKSAPRNLVVLQLRAPLVCKYAKDFLDDVVKTFKGKNISKIIILTSSFAHEKKHILSSPFRYIVTELNPLNNKIQELKWELHDLIGGELKIYGGGFASLLYNIAMENQIHCLIFYKYCSEGDNIPDAYDMINKLSDIIPIFSEKADLNSQLVQPASWKLLFGRPPPKDVY